MSTRSGKPPDAVAILGSLAGVAVVVAGVFYVLGILTTSAELWHAHVSIRDTVAMLPVDQLLSRGVSLVLPVLAGVTAMVAAFVFGERVEKRFQERTEAELESFAAHMPDREAWLAEARDATQRTDWEALGKLLKTAASTADAARRKTITQRRRQAFVLNIPITVLYLVFLLLLPLFLTPVLAVASALTAILWAVFGAQTSVRQGVMGFIVFFAAFLLDPWIDPAPLPTATVKTDTVGVVKGDLLFMQDGRWFLTLPGGKLRIIEPDHVEAATIDYGEPRDLLIEKIPNPAD